MGMVHPHTLGQRRNSGFGHAIKRMVWPRGFAAPTGGCIDNHPAASRRHDGDGGPANPERRFDIYPQRQRPISIAAFGHRPAGDNASVIDDKIKPAHGIAGGLRQSIGILRVEQIP